MSWGAVLALCAAAYALKVGGVMAAGRLADRGSGDSPLDLIVVPVLGALIVVQVFDGGERLVLDARAPAVAVAALLVWRRVPLLVVVLAAGGTAAALRAAGV